MEQSKPLDLRTESPDPSPHTPSAYESKFYYAGISPTPPKLIYRSSSLSRPFNAPTGPEAYRKLRELRPVSDHPIVEIWGEVGRSVVGVLEEGGVQWTSVDGVRFLGDEDVDEDQQGGRKLSPVILWIGLSPSTTSASTAHLASQEILVILASYEINDIEVEFRESTYTPYTLSGSGPALLECVEEFDLTAGVREPLTPSLGLSIAPATANGSDTQGALGVYFTVGDGEDGKEKLLGLTSRHVVFPSSSSKANEDYTHAASDPKEEIQLLGTKGYENFLDSIRRRVRLHGFSVDIFSSRIKSYEEKLLVAAASDRGDEILTKKLARTRAELDETNRAIEALEKFYGDVERNWSRPEDRIIGHVIRAPAVKVDEEGYIKDIAIIELDQMKFEECKGSFIDLGTSSFSYLP